ncbi:MAG TPA: ABC transporter permease [Bacteroidales bacterium]|nr:ABC transporter permease [Bacteroidales bacterium]
MNTELFIARRILSGNRDNFSRPIVRIAILSIALGLAVMLVSVAIVTGFQTQIRDKVIGFGSHIQITAFNSNVSYESNPIPKKQPFYPGLEKVKGIRHIQVYATKAGIIKTDEQIQGVVLKGIGSDYDWSFFKNKIVEGKPIAISDTGKTDEVLISRNLANMLKLKLHDDLRMYFINQNQTRARKFVIAGIYQTGLEEFDKMYVICDIAHIQKLNNWSTGEVAGFEVLINDFDDLKTMRETVKDNIGYDLKAESIRDMYPQIFDWLALQDTNVAIILTLMVLVSGIAMISTLLILILERTNMIGILKALGMKNSGIRKIFLYNSAYIIGKGLLWGNLAGITLCWFQLHFGIIKLPQESYYVSVVPINLYYLPILLINIGTLLVCMILLIVPSHIISRIQPVKAIRWD